MKPSWPSTPTGRGRRTCPPTFSLGTGCCCWALRMPSAASTPPSPSPTGTGPWTRPTRQRRPCGGRPCSAAPLPAAALPTAPCGGGRWGMGAPTASPGDSRRGRGGPSGASSSPSAPCGHCGPTPPALFQTLQTRWSRRTGAPTLRLATPTGGGTCTGYTWRRRTRHFGPTTLTLTRCGRPGRGRRGLSRGSMGGGARRRSRCGLRGTTRWSRLTSPPRRRLTSTACGTCGTRG